MTVTWDTTVVHKIIGDLCRESYERVNKLKSGKYRKPERPYPVPAEAMALVRALNADDEAECKRIMFHIMYGSTSLI